MSTDSVSFVVLFFISVKELLTKIGIMSPKLSLDMTDVFLKVII